MSPGYGQRNTRGGAFGCSRPGNRDSGSGSKGGPGGKHYEPDCRDRDSAQAEHLSRGTFHRPDKEKKVLNPRRARVRGRG
jgi:hypothetical protein